MNPGIPIRVILRFGLDETVVAMFFILGTKILFFRVNHPKSRRF